MNEPGSKPFDISKQVVVAAFEKVRSNKGAAGLQRAGDTPIALREGQP